MTEPTQNNSLQSPVKLAPPELPTEATPTTTTSTSTPSTQTSPQTEAKQVQQLQPQPSAYQPISGPSKTVSSARYNPLNDDNKSTPIAPQILPKATNSKHEADTDTKEETKQQQPPPHVHPLPTTLTNPNHNPSNTVTVLPTAASLQQQQQQLLAAQMAAQTAAMNPMLAAQAQLFASNMGVNANKGKSVNKYTCWPPQEQQQYLSFHPLGWPIDPDYQYQISNYLGPSMANVSAMGGMGGMGGGINPLLAAQAAAVNNPLSLLAAQAAFNPLLAVGGGLGGGGALGMGMGMGVGVGGGGLGNVGLGGGPSVSSNNATAAALSAAAMASASVGNAAGNMTGKQFSLFVFHLPEDIDDHGLLQLFAPYGAMRSNVMRHDTGRSRGFGFVHFNTRHEAQIAIDMMNGHQIGRKRLRVSFKREEAHEKRTGLQAPVNANSNNAIEQKDGQ